MKTKRLALTVAALLATGVGSWLAWPGRLANTPNKSNRDASVESMADQPKPGRALRAPNPMQRYRDFTPEQRVDFARKGHGPGG